MADDARESLSLDALITNGLTVGGRTVDRVKIRIRGVGWSLVSLPIGEANEDGESDDEENELKPTQVKILEVVAKEQKPMTRRAIANRLKRTAIGGKFGMYITDLLSRGLLFELSGELADDSKKFKKP
jgi:hypothetical protein